MTYPNEYDDDANLTALIDHAITLQTSRSQLNALKRGSPLERSIATDEKVVATIESQSLDLGRDEGQKYPRKSSDLINVHLGRSRPVGGALNNSFPSRLQPRYVVYVV